MEKEFEDLKYDYSNLNLKSQEALNRCADLEKQKETLAKTLDQVQQEKLRLKQTFDNQDEKHRQEIKQIHEFNEHQKQEYFAAHRQIDSKQIVESLKKRLKDYDQTISQYDDYRNKLEVNLQKLIQQRDRHKSDLKVTRQMLAEKDEECRQLAQRLNENHHVHRNEIIAPVSRKLAMQESNLIGSSISPVSFSSQRLFAVIHSVCPIACSRRKN